MKTLFIALSFFISVCVFSQNINNTLGTNGVFSIKNLSTNYLTLSQSTGQVNILKTLRLENTTGSSIGIIFKGTDRFLHNYGANNIFLGINAGNFSMTGYNNTAVGNNSFFSNTTGYDNTAVGTSTLISNTTGYNNTAMGWRSLYSNTTGYSNTAVGYMSLFSNTTGRNNLAIGDSSLYSNTTGRENTAVGKGTLTSNTIGRFNVALGFQTLRSNTSGDDNTAVGDGSLVNNTSGSGNTSLGKNCLLQSTTSNFNTGVGASVLFANTVGTYNTALGYTAGSTITTGDNVTCLGHNAEPTSGTANNQFILGNNEITSLRCNVQTITSLSDSRDKKNIKDLSLGLDFLMKVKPRLFNWDKREWYDNNISDGSKMKEAPTAGFIAQELDEVQATENAEWLNLVLKDNPEKFEATSGNLLPVIVKAIQELNVESEKLKAENFDLKNRNNEMSQRLLKLEQTQNILVSELEKYKLNQIKITQIKKGEVK